MSRNEELCTAAAQGSVAVVRRILASGEIDINWTHPGLSDMTALHLAAISGHDDVVNVLISHRANVNALGMVNITPLIAAAHTSSSNALEILLKSNADINAQAGIDGGTPLHTACGNDKIANVKVLLKYSADVNVTDEWGETPLSLARKRKHTTVVQYIEQFIQKKTQISPEEKFDISTNPNRYVATSEIDKQPNSKTVHQDSSQKQNVQPPSTPPKVPEKFKDLEKSLKKWKLSRFFDFFVENDVDMEILKMFDANELLTDLKESDFKVKLSEKKLFREMLKGLSKPKANAKDKDEDKSDKEGEDKSKDKNDDIDKEVDNLQDKLNDMKTCVICFSAPRDTIIKPCGHAQFCENCLSNIDVCPTCRGVVKEKQRFYM